jgi:DNA-directed RNA polymerase specialized sigma24 family protein
MAAMNPSPPLALPDTFLAFHTLRWIPYLRYACQRLDSADIADQAVRETFGDLAVTWLQVLGGPNPPAHAWRLLNNRIRRHAAGAGTRLCRLPGPEDDITLLHYLQCPPEQIADLTGMNARTVRALLARRCG